MAKIDVDTCDRLRSLREHASTLITTQRCFEETMTELNNLFQQLEDDRRPHLRGQILLATTTVLFAYEPDETSKDVFDAWLLAHFHRLWELARRTGVPTLNGDSLQLRETACECLIDVEESLPCLLLHKLEELVSLVLSENFYPFQNYLNLISLVLCNAATVDRSITKRTNELLGLMNKPVLHEDQLSNFSGMNLNKLLVQLMDFTPLLSTCSVRYIVSNVAQVVDALRLNPSIFKTFVHRNRSTYDLVVLDVIHELKDLFGERLFAKNERDALIERTVSKLALPHYDVMLARRCLLLDWTIRYLQAADVVYDPEFFVPLPWDAPEVEEKKIALLALMVCGRGRSPVYWNVLVKCLGCLFSRLDHDVDGHQIVTLCKLLYHCCVCDASFEEVDIEVDIAKILLSVLSDHPQFTEHTIALLRRIKQNSRRSQLVHFITSSAVKCIVDMPSSEVAANGNLIYYLLFLVEATEKVELDTPSETSMILRFISRMMDCIGSNNIEEPDDSGIWFLGHRTLEICKHFLCHRNTNIYFSEIGEVLHRLATSHTDLDVRDRAEFYYMLLTTLSPRKITALLNFCPQVQPGNYNFTQMIGCKSTYAYPPPVLAVSEVIFELTRIAVQFANRKDFEQSSHIEVNVNDYFCWLNDDNIVWRADFTYDLSIASNAGREYQSLYAIVVSFFSTSSSSDVQSVEVLKLCNGKESAQVAVTVVPSSVICSFLQVNVIFSRQDGLTCSTSLAPIAVRFPDLLQPLPVPVGHDGHPNIWRRQLAEKLWSEFSDHNSKKYFQSVVHVIAKCETYKSLMLKSLEPFITQMYTTGDEEMKCTIGIFLPIRSHLILRTKYVEWESGFMVHFVTDDQAVLPQINIFLRNLEDSH